MPELKLKLKYFEKKNLIEVGVDEAGRGCLAGPVYAAAVILPDKFPDDKYKQIKDSKKLSEKKREELFEYITRNVKDYSIAQLSAQEIDKINILQASFNAMHNAIDGLAIIPDHLLIDGNRFKPYQSIEKDDFIEHTCIKSGDNKYIAIAAASILAKVSRDRYMKLLCNKDPTLDTKYGWIKNKAYATKQHRDGIQRHGLTEYHRKTFGICKNYI
jgi:ribonuclease HII